MRKRYVVWAGLVAAGGAVAFLVGVGCAGPQTTVTRANCGRVAEGMTEAEVEAIFGHPADVRQEIPPELKPTRELCRVNSVGLPPEAAYTKVWRGTAWGASLAAVVTFTEEGNVVFGPAFLQIERRCWIQKVARCLDIEIPY
jgi:hypothetical protein